MRPWSWICENLFCFVISKSTKKAFGQNVCFNIIFVIYIGAVSIGIIASAFCVLHFSLFVFLLTRFSFFRRQESLFITVYKTSHALKNIKNKSHDTIHTFKNYFTTVFSVFSFSKNKLYSNRLIVFVWIRMKCGASTFHTFFFSLRSVFQCL